MSAAMIGPKFYGWDRNGKPLAFGKLYTYQARSNTPKPTYQSEDQAVENTNPVILNGEGYANIYLNGSYKMVLKDKNDNEIWTSDPVSSSEASEWTLCLAATYLSPTSFKVPGNFTSQYDVGRRVRLSNDSGSYAYSTIETTTFATGETTITIKDPVVTTNIVDSCISIVGSKSLTYSGANVPSIKDLGSIPNPIDKSGVSVNGFYSGSVFGGGNFIWDASKDKATHNGGTIIAPEAIAAWDGSGVNIAALLNWTGTGAGCWVRVYEAPLRATSFGLTSELTPSGAKLALNKFHSEPSSSYFLDVSGDIVVDGVINFEEKVRITYTCMDSTIRSNNISEPVMRLSGRNCSITKLPTLGYLRSIDLDYGTTTNIGMIALELTGLARSNIGEIRINHAGFGLKLREAPGFGFPTANNFFSVTIGFLDISDISYQFFDLRPWQGGNTGSVITSLYMNNNDLLGNRQACVRFGDIGGTSEILFSLMNCEHAVAEMLLRFSSDADTVNITTLHIEGVQLKNGTREYLYLNADTKLSIGSLGMTYNYFDSGSGNLHYLARLGTNTTVNIGNMKERNAILTGSPAFKMYRFGATAKTNSYIDVKSLKSVSFPSILTGDGDSSTYRQPPVLRVDDAFPVKESLVLTDSSIVWNAKAATSRVLIYKGQTTVRTFSTLETGRYDGASCTIFNSSETYEIIATLGSKVFNIPVSASVRVACDGENWYIS